MTNPAKLRADLARGHILLGELDVAHACLARVVQDAPDLVGLDELLDALIEACAASDSPWLERVSELRDAWLRTLAVPAKSSAERVDSSVHPSDDGPISQSGRPAHASGALAEGVAEVAHLLDEPSIEETPAPSRIALSEERPAAAVHAAPRAAPRDMQRMQQRAAQIARLEAWLGRVRRRYGGESAHDVP